MCHVAHFRLRACMTKPHNSQEGSNGKLDNPTAIGYLVLKHWERTLEDFVFGKTKDLANK